MIEIKLENGRVIHVPDTGSPCELWRGYFDRLGDEFGKENAKMLWLVTWQTNGSATCTTNTDFNNWLRRNDIDVSSAFTRAVADGAQIGSNLMGLGKNITQMISVGVPVVLGVALLGIVWMIVRSAKETNVADMAALHPAGRAAMAGGAI